jgi:adenylosuccinate lyase
MDPFDNISPLDYRYYGRDKDIFSKLAPYLSENARIRYQLRTELALVRVLARRGICPQSVVKDVESAIGKVTAQEVYEKEDRIRHDVRALANAIREKVPDGSKPFVHFTATSYDIVNTSTAARFRDFTADALVPALLSLEKTIIAISRREKDTLQIGRTHGQHAEPITFGFAMAEYVSRLGGSIEKVRDAAGNLRGKFSGAVGAYNASSLFFSDPEKFEEEVLAELRLKPGTHSTQITEPECMADYVHSVVSAFGVLANLADDMRHLQRSEIAEVGEAFDSNQVGSSTMPHKRNPVNFENVKSMWKAFMPMMSTVYMDQISEHQRDLTNSASARFVPELLAGFYVSVDRMQKTLSKLSVDKASLKKNFSMGSGMVVAEPIYIILAAHGHPDAHEYVKQLTLKAQQSGKSLIEIFYADPSARPYISKLSAKQKETLSSPEKYTGIAGRKAEEVCSLWEKRLGL